VARYTIEEYVRWEDIDAAGIINYQAYLRFFGLAEAELLRSAGLNYRFLFEVLGIWLPRVRVECSFFLPVKLDELLAVEAYFSRIGRTSVHLDFEVRRKSDPARVVASGRYVLVCVAQKDFRPVPVPGEVREKILRFLEAAPPRPVFRKADMPRGKDWVELVRSTFRSVGREEMSGLYVREWRNAREKLTAEDHTEIERERRRPKRFFKTANAVLFGLSKRLAPARRVLFGAVLLFILLSIQGPFVSRRTKDLDHGVRRTSEYKFFFDNGMLLASITLLTLLLAMELVDKINYRDELDLARELQSSLIPKILPAAPGYDIGAYNRIANMVGGDIYDFVLLPDGRLAVLFGDASGHGMTAGDLELALERHATSKLAVDEDLDAIATLAVEAGRRSQRPLSASLLTWVPGGWTIVAP